MPVRFMNLVEPLGACTPAGPTARRTTDTTARHTSAARSGAVSPLIGAIARLRRGDVDSSTLRSTRATTPGARTSSTATATPTTRTTSSALAPSADSTSREGRTIAVLFARADSHYKAIPCCDVWDEARDARKWPGGTPLIAHPPCRAWGRLRQFAKPRPDEKQLGIDAVAHVRRYGGVLEHPDESTLFPHCRMPEPGEFPDEWGGWTLYIEQFHWGHRAQKATWLYIVGCGPADLPPMPRRPGRATHCVRPTKSYPRLPSITKAEREHTPPQLAAWLVELASRCKAPELTQ